jgi:hypothetical protein
MRSRPEVLEMMVTRTARPGDDVEVRCVLKSGSATPVDAITLRLEGTERFRLAQNQAPAVLRSILHQIATLKSKGELAEGNHEFKARFRLPADASPTFLGRCILIDYVLTLHVDIPWWPDLKKEYTVKVAPPIFGRPQRAPVAQTTARGGEEPFIELTLDDTVLQPGDAIMGALALGNLRGRKVRDLHMALLTVESVKGRTTQRGEEYPAHFGPDVVREGKEFPFRFTVPKTVPPGFETPLSSLSYVLEVRVKFGWQKDVTHHVPVTIAAMDRPAEDVRSRPRLGAERWRAVWEHAGAPLGLGVADPEDLRLEGWIAGIRTSVFVDPDADETSFAAELTWTSWGIDLRVRTRRVSLLVSDPDGDGFGRRYKVHGRDPGQVRPLFAAPLRKALLAFEEAYVDDRHARVKSKTAGLDQPHIGRFLQDVVRLAAELSSGAARIPPPMGLVEALPAWRIFAAELGAELTVGSMSLTGGTLDGARFEVETLFDDRVNPARSRVTLAVDPPLSAAFDPYDADAWRAAPPGALEVAGELKKWAGEARMTPHSFEVVVPMPLEDPASLRPKMETMLVLIKRLRGEKSAGPYR